jgi:hypothetical protein
MDVRFWDESIPKLRGKNEVEREDVYSEASLRPIVS